jgi:predicted transcriptional regulator
MTNKTKQRSRWDVIFDILFVVAEEESAKKTRIMQRANLDWRSFTRYFNFLVVHDFIRTDDESEKRKDYKLTTKGELLLQKLQELEELLRWPSYQHEVP